MRAKRLAGLGAGVIGLPLIKRRLPRAERRRHRRERIPRAYAVAAQDPEYLADEADLVRAFDPTVADGLIDVGES